MNIFNMHSIGADRGVRCGVLPVIRDFLTDEAGATSAEYALILGLIAAVLLIPLNSLVDAIAKAVNATNNGFNTAS